MGTHHHDAILVKEPCGILADVRNIGSKLLHTTLGLTYLSHEFVNVN